MPRQNDAGELWKRLTELSLFREVSGGGSQATTAPVLGDGTETTIGVAATTSFTAADPVFVVGDGGLELLTIGTPATSMPVTPPPKIAQSTGATMIEAVKVSLGKIVPDSVQWSASRSLQAVFEEVADAPVVYLNGNIEFALQFALYGYNGPNVQLLSGYAESETGTGASATTPHQVALGLPNQAIAGRQVFRVQGLRHDGKKVQVDFLNSYVEAAIQSTLGKTNPATLNGTAKSSAIIVRTWA